MDTHFGVNTETILAKLKVTEKAEVNPMDALKAEYTALLEKFSEDDNYEDNLKGLNQFLTANKDVIKGNELQEFKKAILAAVIIEGKNLKRISRIELLPVIQMRVVLIM